MMEWGEGAEGQPMTPEAEFDDDGPLDLPEPRGELVEDRTYEPREAWKRGLDENLMEVVAEFPGGAYVLDPRDKTVALLLRTPGRRKNRHRAIAHFFEPGAREGAIRQVRAIQAEMQPKKKRGRPRKPPEAK